MNNLPHDITGLDDPHRRWMDKIVLVKTHPEWGSVRVMRWFPSSDTAPALLRVLSPGLRAPQLVGIDDVQVIASTTHRPH